MIHGLNLPRPRTDHLLIKWFRVHSYMSKLWPINRSNHNCVKWFNGHFELIQTAHFNNSMCIHARKSHKMTLRIENSNQRMISFTSQGTPGSRWHYIMSCTMDVQLLPKTDRTCPQWEVTLPLGFFCFFFYGKRDAVIITTYRAYYAAFAPNQE